MGFLRQKNVITIAVPAHCSYELQPLEVTVFSTYKSSLQKELHCATRAKSKLNAFDIGLLCNQSAYARAFIAPIINSGFVQCGIWDEVTGG